LGILKAANKAPEQQSWLDSPRSKTLFITTFLAKGEALRILTNDLPDNAH